MDNGVVCLCELLYNDFLLQIGASIIVIHEKGAIHKDNRFQLFDKIIEIDGKKISSETSDSDLKKTFQQCYGKVHGLIISYHDSNSLTYGERKHEIFLYLPKKGQRKFPQLMIQLIPSRRIKGTPVNSMIASKCIESDEKARVSVLQQKILFLVVGSVLEARFFPLFSKISHF